MLNALNTNILDKSTIKITGIAALKDSLYQINNLTGIQARTHFYNKSSYTYSLSIPLKYIASTTGQKDKISYAIKLNGRFYSTNTTLTISADGNFTLRSTPGYGSVEVKNTPEIMTLDYPTDFAGEYILAKKP